MNLGFNRCLIFKPISGNEVSKQALVVQMLFVYFSCVVQMIPLDNTYFIKLIKLFPPHIPQGANDLVWQHLFY